MTAHVSGRGSIRTLAAVPNLDGMLATRLRQGVGSTLADVRASVVFVAPGVGRWTIRLNEGRTSLYRGASRRPAAIVTADPATLAAVVEGRMSGVEAYLSHGLEVRGNLALALQMDGAFDVGERPVTHPRSAMVRVLGARTAYLEAGPRSAPPVILLHGLGATNASMLPTFQDLARDHRVLAPDLPGFGASDAPRWQYRPVDFAEWLSAFQRSVGALPAAVVGNSLGGRVAIEAGLSHSANVTKIVGLCPSPAFRRLRQMVPAVRLLTPELARLPLWTHHRFVVESIRLMFARPDRLPRHWFDAGADEFRRIMRSASHRRAFFAAMRQVYLEDAYGEHGFWDRLPRLGTPALFIWGDRDRLVPAGFERHVTAAVPEARSVLLDDCGHVPQFELPERTNALVRDFLTS